MNYRTRLRSAQNNKGDHVSQMPDDVLVKILSLLSIKDALGTSCLSTRWRFLWCGINRLKFDGSETLETMAHNLNLLVLEQAKYVNHVNSVIQHHNHPIVQVFRIRFDLDRTYFQDIDNWIQFALNKKVEKLKLDLTDHLNNVRDPNENYDFPIPVSDGNMVHLFERPSSSVMVVEILSLKKLVLNGVKLSQSSLDGFLKHAPHLEVISMYRSSLSSHIHIGGRDINLKHFKLVSCLGVESFSLYDFDLVSFMYIGPKVEYHFSDLPKLKELDIGRVSMGWENNVLHQISSCAPYLQVLYLDIIDSPSASDVLDFDAITKLPNVKKLFLTVGAEEDDSLLGLTSIAQACPSLETLEFSLIWFSLIRRRRRVKHVAAHSHEHLKLLQIYGYYGRISDLELVAYVIENAAVLKKVVIDPVCHGFGGDWTKKEVLKAEQAARSCAKRQITSILPSGVELAVL